MSPALTPTQAREAQAIADYLRPQYLDVRVLPDGSVAALHELIYTRAILLSCTRYGFGHRWCYADREEASRVFARLESEDDELTGWIARRGPYAPTVKQSLTTAATAAQE